MTGFLLRALISAIGLWLASVWVTGVRIHGPGTLLLAAVLLGVVNAVVRPIAFILTLPLTILTLGLFLFASVLERFLALYCSMNSFSKMTATIEGRKGELRRWPPRMGEKVLL